jgi:HD-GYP domain-containing protein (c-di-GMP phosphodiesterase class II)
MSDSKEMLQKIAALRLRLDQAQKLVDEANTSAAAATAQSGQAVAALEDKVRRGGWHHALLDSAMRGIEPAERPSLPSRLTQRAARLVQRARDMSQELRALAEDPILQQDPRDPLAELHAVAASMIESVLRTVQAFPPSPSAQLRLCAGPDAVLDVVAERIGVIKAGMRHRSVIVDRVDRLADILQRIASGQAVSVQPLEQLAHEVRDDARAAVPLRFPRLQLGSPARAAALHGLNVAQVLARVMADDADWHGRELEGLVAALVHDVGMVLLPSELVTQAGPLTEEQRRLVERHPLAGAQALVKLWPGGGWTVDAAADHHERNDGTGYPRGKRDVQLSDEVKLLAVCDVYAALASSRPWRAGHDPRTAMADTLLLADRGALDMNLAERLLRLAYHPAGSVVELDDGSVALVLTPQSGEQALTHPHRPVVSVLREPHGQTPAAPRYLTLAAQTERTIVRSLGASERRQVVGHCYPELV